MHSKAGIYVVMCKKCIASGSYAVHIKQDCLIPAQATTVTTVVAGNKSFAEDVVCMVVSYSTIYIKDQLLIPSSLNEI